MDTLQNSVTEPVQPVSSIESPIELTEIEQLEIDSTETEGDLESSVTFADFNLLEPIQRALSGEKYSSPTPIQAEAIPLLLEGRDLLGIAQTGTGKTAAFALPILHRLGQRVQRTIPLAPRALILSPTRELAMQIAEKFRIYGQHMRIWTGMAFGGVSQFHQVRDLRRGVHILVATPGRLLDLIDQGHLFLDRLEVLVLDEADRMLDMGFMPDINRIVSLLPEERQSLFFSATMPPKIEELARTLLKDPARVDLTPSQRTVELIEQRVMHVSQTDKRSLLCHILDERVSGQALVFARTKHGAERLAEQLSKAGFSADAIHGDKTQSARQRALFDFKNGRTRVLVATDVAARGIDIQGLSYVINYELPIDPESYVHRVGRTGRAGASGVAVSFCDPRERGALKAIEREIGIRIQVETDHPHALPVPQARNERLLDRGGRRPAGGGGGQRGGYGQGQRGGYGQGGPRGQRQPYGGGPRRDRDRFQDEPRGGDQAVPPVVAAQPVQPRQFVPQPTVQRAEQGTSYVAPAQESQTQQGQYGEQQYGQGQNRGRQGYENKGPRRPASGPRQGQGGARYQQDNGAPANAGQHSYGDYPPPQSTETYGSHTGRRPFRQNRRPEGGGYRQDRRNNGPSGGPIITAR